MAAGRGFIWPQHQHQQKKNEKQPNPSGPASILFTFQKSVAPVEPVGRHVCHQLPVPPTLIATHLFLT